MEKIVYLTMECWEGRLTFMEVSTNVGVTSPKHTTPGRQPSKHTTPFLHENLYMLCQAAL